jgi:hypothetical protein
VLFRSEIGAAIVAAYNLAQASNSLPEVFSTLGVTGAGGLTYYVGGGTDQRLVFAQNTPTLVDLDTVLADSVLFKEDNSARPVGFTLSPTGGVTGIASGAASTQEFAVVVDGGGVHPGGVITVNPGIGGADIPIIIPTGYTATQIASAIETALAAHYTTTATTDIWDVTSSGAMLIFTDTTNASVGNRGDVITNFSIGNANGINKLADSADITVAGLLNLVNDTSVPVWDPAINSGNGPTLANNGINVTVVTGPIGLDGLAPTRDGQSEWLDQIGSVHQPRETQGDADYLDFSAYDAYAVVLGATNTNPILSVTDTAGTHHYVRIVERAGDASGTYDFTLYDAGTDGIGSNDSTLGLIGTVDFGESVNFVASNFILYNDIIV